MELDKTFIFELNPLVAGEKVISSQVSELKEILKGSGVEVDQDGSHLKITVNMEQYKRIATRGAGRSKDFRKDTRYKLQPTIGEVKRMKVTMTHAEIIDLIGCPRATYYRAWKELRKSCTDTTELDNCPFFSL